MMAYGPDDLVPERRRKAATVLNTSSSPTKAAGHSGG